MSVKTLESYQEFTADGSTTYFTFNFNYVDSSEIVVGMRTGDNQYTVVDPVSYVLTQNASTDGGKIRFVTTKPCENPDDPTCGDYIDNPPPAGTIVRIERKTVQSSTADWQVGLDMTTLVALFDKVFRITQENAGRIDNAIKTFPTQQGILLHELLEKHNDKIFYWDNEKKTITPADIKYEDIVQASGGMFFRISQNKLEYSIDNKTWYQLPSKQELQDLQSQINTNKTNIDKNKSDINTLNTQVSDLYSKTDILKTRTDSHDKHLSQHEKDISELQTQTVDLYSKHATLKSRVDRHDDDLTELDESVADLYDKKLDKNQGKLNVGKVLTVGGDGMVVPKVPQGGGSGIGVVAHDNTLIGAGTDEYPLGVKNKVTITIVEH